MTEPSADVRRIIAARIAEGVLPREKCQVTWFGPGRGLPCAACGTVVSEREIEVECEIPGRDLIRLHRECYVAWEQEREPSCG